MFVSVVSTRVPFKGTGKEYVAYDITEIQQAVKEAVEVCALAPVLRALSPRGSASA